MKIGVISDTHGVVTAWQKAMEVFTGADMILHAGDVLYHPPRLGITGGYDLPELVHLMNACPIPIIIARGNCDADVYEELFDMPVMSPYATAEVDGLRVVVTHGHTLAGNDIERLSSKYHAQVFITGHTHIPIVQRIGETIHMNPGSPSHPKFERDGIPFRTVGLITDGKVQVVALETGEEIMALTL